MSHYLLSLIGGGGGDAFVVCADGPDHALELANDHGWGRWGNCGPFTAADVTIRELSPVDPVGVVLGGR